MIGVFQSINPQCNVSLFSSRQMDDRRSFYSVWSLTVGTSELFPFVLVGPLVTSKKDRFNLSLFCCSLVVYIDDSVTTHSLRVKGSCYAEELISNTRHD